MATDLSRRAGLPGQVLDSGAVEVLTCVDSDFDFSIVFMFFVHIPPFSKTTTDDSP